MLFCVLNVFSWQSVVVGYETSSIIQSLIEIMLDHGPHIGMVLLSNVTIVLSLCYTMCITGSQ